MLTEPPLNPPENREETAEIMFETFGVAGLFIGVQVLMLCLETGVLSLRSHVKGREGRWSFRYLVLIKKQSIQKT